MIFKESHVKICVMGIYTGISSVHSLFRFQSIGRNTQVQDIRNHVLDFTTTRALCRIKLLPVTHVLVDIWMLTVKPVYKLSNVHADLKLATNTHMTPFIITFKACLIISMVLEDLFYPSFFYLSTTRPPIFLPVHTRFYPSK